MRANFILVSVATLALAACGRNDNAANEVVESDVIIENMTVDTDNNMVDLNAAAATTASSGQEYAAMAAAGDLYEIESSTLLIGKSKNGQLTELAEMIVADHKKSTADLKTAAAQSQPAILVTASLTPEQQANIEALRAAGPEEIDQVWILQQIPAHEKTLVLLEDYSQNGDVPALKQHAAATAPAVKKHLDSLRQAQNK